MSQGHFRVLFYRQWIPQYFEQHVSLNFYLWEGNQTGQGISIFLVVPITWPVCLFLLFSSVFRHRHENKRNRFGQWKDNFAALGYCRTGKVRLRSVGPLHGLLVNVWRFANQIGAAWLTPYMQCWCLPWGMLHFGIWKFALSFYSWSRSVCHNVKSWAAS